MTRKFFNLDDYKDLEMGDSMRHNRFKLILLLIIVLGLVLSACSKDEEEATPEGVFEKYISYWMEEDFSSMYELLSSDSKDYISQEDFLARYENIYSGIGAGNIEISFTTEEEEASDEVEEVDLAYSLKDRKSTRLNSSHVRISYAVFCLKK